MDEELCKSRGIIPRRRKSVWIKPSEIHVFFVLYYTKKAESDDWQCFIIRSNISKLKKCLSLRKSSSFACPLRAAFYSKASETRACVKITPREKRRHAAGKKKNEWFLRALQMGAFTNGYYIDLARAKTKLPL